MPINYVDLHPQISQYCQRKAIEQENRKKKLALALSLLDQCQNRPEIYQKKWQESATKDLVRQKRFGFPISERINQPIPSPDAIAQYQISASDGSQIIPDRHEALQIALVNVSAINYLTNSGRIPAVTTKTTFITDETGQIAVDLLPDDFVKLSRDLAELMILLEVESLAKVPHIMLIDGPIELFHQPRMGGEYAVLFQEYINTLIALSQTNRILGGCIDKPRSPLIGNALSVLFQEDLNGLPDTDIFSTLLQPNQRSAIFRLIAFSSLKYPEPVSIRFFYLNVGNKTFPWIIRVEIPAWVADNKVWVNYLHRAILDQCRVLGNNPYPYVLHRAHEEAIVHIQEKENLSHMITAQLMANGQTTGKKSYKLIAKELQLSTRI